ncbi:2-hydroxyacid dehydrogenase [Marinomonas sp. IMCC 4694]|uniref:2-hydroxyacid dehydrogenase n=1 Tax=Marinomonas sp. IMCC 4694 TaxID=2605432 RepID=UPI001653042D|nr:glyoxylate/hydroxypyruvate reductase A [Marinomonas sp. IMCC 4694]
MVIPFVSRLDLDAQQAWIDVLSAAMPDEHIVPFATLTPEQKSACHLAIVADPEPNDLLALPALTWVHSVWAGVERMVHELVSPTFSIVRLVDPQLADTMSEAVLAWTLFLHRDMPAYAKQQANYRWEQRPMVQAKERRIGVLGLGELGKVSALRLAHNGFSVAGWSRNEKHIAGITCFDGHEGLVSLLRQSDILVCLLPLTSETKGLLSRESLAYLPAGAGLINFARGLIIDDNALLEKLDQGVVSHAVLDVFMQEPLPKNHQYWQHHAVTVLPHISAPTHLISASLILADNIKYYRMTGIIPSCVDVSRGY